MKNIFNKRAFFRTVLFLVILVALLQIVSQIMVRLSDEEGKHNVRMRNYIYTDLIGQEKDTIDVIVTGDSEAVADWTPLRAWEQQGFTSFPAAMPAFWMTEMLPMVRLSFRTQKPKVLLFETNMLFSYTDPIKGTVKIAQSEIRNRLMIFRFHNIWKHVISPLPEQDSLWKSFRVRTEVVPPKNLNKYMKPSSEKRKICPMNLLIFDQLVKLCRKNGVQLVLYSTAAPKNYGMRKHNTLTELAERYGLTYIDLNTQVDQVGINWQTDSLDMGDHMNLSGAQKVTAYLADRLKEAVPDLPDHRADEKYSDWSEQAEAYDAAIADDLKEIRGE